MTTQTRWAVALMGGVLALAATAPAGAQIKNTQDKEKIFKQLTPLQIEAVLKSMDITFKKTQPPKLDQDWDFDFERNNYSLRLTLSKGKLLWISCSFPPIPLQSINDWNQKAKFSRAVLDSVGGREYAVVEYQLDAGGGVTESMLKQFIRRFDGEVSTFDQFLRKN